MEEYTFKELRKISEGTKVFISYRNSKDKSKFNGEAIILKNSNTAFRVQINKNKPLILRFWWTAEDDFLFEDDYGIRNLKFCKYKKISKYEMINGY